MTDFNEELKRKNAQERKAEHLADVIAQTLSWLAIGAAIFLTLYYVTGA